MSYLDRITFNPDQCAGFPCIRNYRLRVKDVLDLLGAGATESEILKDYPFLQAEDIRACLQYAAVKVDQDSLAESMNRIGERWPGILHQNEQIECSSEVR